MKHQSKNFGECKCLDSPKKRTCCLMCELRKETIEGQAAYNTPFDTNRHKIGWLIVIPIVMQWWHTIGGNDRSSETPIEYLKHRSKQSTLTMDNDKRTLHITRRNFCVRSSHLHPFTNFWCTGKTIAFQVIFSAPEVISYLMGWGDRFISHHFVTIYWSTILSLLKNKYPELRCKM